MIETMKWMLMEWLVKKNVLAVVPVRAGRAQEMRRMPRRYRR